MERLAREIMESNVVTVTPSTPLRELARIFAEDEISGAPVVEVDGRLVGIVSKTDLLNAVADASQVPGGTDPYFEELFGPSASPMKEMESEEERESLGSVDDIMETEIITVAPTETVSRVAARMAKGRIHRVVVVDSGKVVGIITSLDLLSAWPALRPAAPRPKPVRKPRTAPKKPSARRAVRRRPPHRRGKKGDRRNR